MNLSNKTILITGGSSGIGYEMAKEFLKRNNKVIITGRDEQKLQKAKNDLKDLITIRNDVSNLDDIKKLYQQIAKEHPKLNILINNAGVMYSVNLQNHKLSASELTKEIDINLKGTIWMNDAFLPLLKLNKGSAIVNISSGLAFVPLPISAVYCATKAAIHSYSLSLRVQLNNIKIKVFELAPPATDTKLLSAFDDSDLNGTRVMPVDKMVEIFMKGLSNNTYEICPGQSRQLRFMSRFFPNFILKQLSKPVAYMHRNM